MKRYLSSYPELVKEWHPTKNGDLQPEDFTFKSGKKVWWKCLEGDDHEWIVSIANRSNGHGCPYCSGNKVSKTNSFLTKFPKVAKEWHPTKNGNLKPENFTYGSDKKVWWKCPKDEEHEWIARIANRSRRGIPCPFCSGKKTLNYDLFDHISKR
ncbi:zinc-ribbon domain-containing protein [Alphaproteobacteria bacterium]|nr:zinc-ribbon domain-containing protein [Alphaproteobacteria bacterium]